MDLRQIATLYAHEVRSALREKSIVAMSIVVPLVMYPAMLWALFAGMSFVQGQAERMEARVAIHGLPEVHQALADSLRAASRITLRTTDDPRGARQEVVAGRLDAFVEFLEPEDGAGTLANNVQVRVVYNQARDRSVAARSRVESVLESYRRDWIERERRALEVPQVVWADFAMSRTDVATPDDSARFLLALVVPFLILITVALAAFYPAIDATAGERERSTWETLMTVAAPRGNIAAAKYLYVATFGAAGGLLNLAALALSLRWILRPMAGDAAGVIAQVGLPLGALPIIGLGTALLGLLVAAGMLVFAIFARNFKEGQSMITPFYLVIILPALFLQSPDLEFTVWIAAVPVANVALLIREAIMGSVPLVPGIVTLVSMSVCVAAAVAFAQWVMRREEVLLGSAEGGLGRFLQRRLRAARGQG
jgi:sodium transport system permease protein